MSLRIIQVMDIHGTGKNSGLPVDAYLQLIGRNYMVCRRHRTRDSERHILILHLIAAPYIPQVHFTFQYGIFSIVAPFSVNIGYQTGGSFYLPIP